jgi:hypothetical protein
VLTLAEVERLMAMWQQSAECGQGADLRVPDLAILRSGGVDNVVAAVEDLAAELPVLTLSEDDECGERSVAVDDDRRVAAPRPMPALRSVSGERQVAVMIQFAAARATADRQRRARSQ